mmetsp:Transcript_9343/g.29174  ORF Transcript_9343/g.29174 Transcript_9343/m.29174 type:complete len:283 (-) Transcript_9343:527-1375(-)
MLEVPGQREDLLLHHALVPEVVWGAEELRRRAVHEDVLAPRADTVEPRAREPGQAGAFGRRLRGRLRGQRLEGQEALPRRLRERRGHEDPLHGLRQRPAELFHREVHALLHQHVHFVQDHGPAGAEVQRAPRVLKQQPAQAPRRHYEHVGARSDLPLLPVRTVAAGAAVHAEAPAAPGRDDAGHGHDLLREVGRGRQDQQPHAARPRALRWAGPHTAGKEVPPQERQEVGQRLARAGLVSNHRAPPLHEVWEGDELYPRRPRQLQGFRKSDHVVSDAGDLVP